MTPKEWVDSVVAILTALQGFAWPCVSIILLLVFRKRFNVILARLRKGKVGAFEVELERALDDATAARAEIQELPPVVAALEKTQTGARDDLGVDDSTSGRDREVLKLAARSPRAALLTLSADVNRELRQLLAPLGLLPERRAIAIRHATRLLEQRGTLAADVMRSIESFEKVCNRVVHGSDASDEEILRAIDIGTIVLGNLRSLPRFPPRVDAIDLALFADDQGRVPLDVKGVRLEVALTHSNKGKPVVLPTRCAYSVGQEVSWEFDSVTPFPRTWYRDPDSGDLVLAWDAANHLFAGRPLGDV